MPRIPRIDLANTVYHVINRSNARVEIFHDKEDYKLFETVLTQAQERTGMRILAYCMMPNHWHLILYPKSDGNPQSFMSWLTMTHTQRWHAINGTIGSGASVSRTLQVIHGANKQILLAVMQIC